MLLPPITTPLPPDAICGYKVLRSPAPSTYVALADGCRKVLLKPLDTDCLLHRQLHPSIKERLARVRELALKSAANLHGVERDGQGTFLVWEFIEGESLELHASQFSLVRFTSMLREVVLSVAALHQVGIVHGALHARNIIIDNAGRTRLTHISPLLFDDPAADEAAILAMIATLIDQRTDVDAGLRSTLIEPASLRDLAARFITSETPPDELAFVDDEDAHRRQRMLFAAMAVACVGLLIAGVAVFLNRRM